MLFSISENNVEIIKNDLQENHYNHIVIVDYARNLETFLSFLKEHAPDTKQILCFTEQDPRPHIKNLDIHEENIKPWSLKSLQHFLFSAPRISFENHTPVYDGDVSRMSKWRDHYMMGPFEKIGTKIGIAKGVCKFLGYTTQRFLPFLRKKHGTVTGTLNGTSISLFFDNSPEKDHYGESPLIEEKLKLFEQQSEHILSNSNNRICFFIVTGPRQEYINAVLNLSHDDQIGLFAAALYRPKAYDSFDHQNTGDFYKGSNTTIFNKSIYSDHCLSIGAGEKELWVLKSSKQEMKQA